MFDVQHIKGMEFEAVFSASINQPIILHPALLDKYLYVDITHTATHLDATCQGSLPSAPENLRLHFCRDWQQDNQPCQYGLES